MADGNNEMGKIEERLKSLELRLERLEASLNEGISPKKVYNDEQVPLTVSEEMPDTSGSEDRGLESKIGRIGLAWLGNFVLLVGIAFLAQYLMNIGSKFTSILLGYIAAGSIYILSDYIKKTNVHLAFIFKLNAQVLLFYITLRLHFFSALPVLQGKTFAVILLLLLVALQVFHSIRCNSQVFGMLSVIFLLTTSIVVDSRQFTLLFVTLSGAGSIWYFYRFRWEPLVVTSIILVYLTSLLWLFGNPFMGHQMQLITEQPTSIIYLFAMGAIYSLMPLFRKSDKSVDDYMVSVTTINGAFFTLLLGLLTLRFYHSNYVNIFAIITACCLLYSAYLKSTSDWNFATAFYSLYGFLAMSISLYGLFGYPQIYLLLSFQSLLVVTIALWYRNRLIVIMNSLLFLSILIIYITSSKSINSVNFSFALVPLISARIINWKQSRLQIETDLIRNLYLIEGFVMVLFALFHAVPGRFITLSWTMAALIYFLLSFILKNVKYRYMALGTMISATFYLFIVDLAKTEIIFRVLALLFLAAISIGISIYYTNRIKKSGS